MLFSFPYTLVLRALRALYLSLLPLLAWSAAAYSAEDSITATLAADCSTGAGAVPQVMDVQLALTGEQVQATLSMPLSPLTAAGCVVAIPFQVPAKYRPSYARWRDVEGQAMQADGTPVPVPLRLWIQTDGTLQYEVRMAEVKAGYLAYDLDLAWGATAVGNNQAVLDIRRTALGVELDQAVYQNESGRVTELDRYDNHLNE